MNRGSRPAGLWCSSPTRRWPRRSRGLTASSLPMLDCARKIKDVAVKVRLCTSLRLKWKINWEIKMSFLQSIMNFPPKVFRSPFEPCREEENLVSWFGAQFISTLNFNQSGWLILFSLDLHFHPPKLVSRQTQSLWLETATRTDVPPAVPT